MKSYTQKNLFGLPSAEQKVAEKPKLREKSSFPVLSLAKGLGEAEATAESVFWHRILLNNAIRQQKSKQFLSVLSNEIAIKKGTKDSYLAIIDSLKISR